jgi:hypothetical protein
VFEGCRGADTRIASQKHASGRQVAGPEESQENGAGTRDETTEERYAHGRREVDRRLPFVRIEHVSKCRMNVIDDILRGT